MYKLNTHQNNRVKRSVFGRSTDFEQDVIEYIGNFCYIPIKCHCFKKCIHHLTGRYYTEEMLTLIQIEQRQSIVSTTSRFQTFCKNHNINIGCDCGFRVCPKNNKEIIVALYMYKNHFCSICKTQGVSFNKTIEE